ncbi:beta-lactamase family protein [Nocardia sp. NBC_00881]|uniref:serine hydrolase domain-containing protein n=1 Tax=Nocardia sp. NBC_00881 TaxID=2975995 RepID=UPI00386F2963|nr:beta-lactamase family protein [Nocardia sp. NBC_00881]
MNPPDLRMNPQVVADPAEVGIDRWKLDVLLRRVALEVEHGPLPSAQVAIARHGRLVASTGWGEQFPRYLLQSVGRTFVGSAIWKLMGEGRIDITAPVASVIPEFGTNGKDVVTVEHVLTHTAGFPFAPLGYPKMKDRELRLQAFAKWRLDNPPGDRLQFHLTSAAWVIAELVERITGRTLPDYLRSEITEPLGLGFGLGVPAAEQAATVAPMVRIGSTEGEVDPWGPWFLNNPDVVAAGEPAHSVAASAADVALHYQALLHSPLWAPGVVADAIRPRVTEVPAGEQIYGGSAKRVGVGLFVVVAGPDAGMWMPSVGSPRTFGHGGAAYQLGFCDPDSGVSFALLSNGYPASGYDYSPRGIAAITNIGNSAADLVTD